MTRCVWTALLLLVSLLLPWPGRAQEDGITVDADDFWARLTATDRILQASSSGLLSTADAQVRALWTDVRRVRAGDAVIDVDLGWLTDLPPGDSAAQTARAVQVRALLDYHARLNGAANDPGALLAALAGVLDDPRFQYVDLTPTPIAEPPEFPDIPDMGDGLSGVSQIIVIGGGILLAVLAVLYLARTLRVQPAELRALDGDADPVTATEAVTLADDRATLRDYRAAVRYLYLSSLLLLAERGVLHYDASLTNREHLRQLQAQPALHDLLGRIVNTFEDVWYGFEPIDDAFYRQYADHIEQLRRLVT